LSLGIRIWNLFRIYILGFRISRQGVTDVHD
jgi:hypothetical protein